MSATQPATQPNSLPLRDAALVPARLLAPVLAATATWIVGAYVALVLASPYWNDDTINKNLPTFLKTTHTSLGSFIWGQISAFVRVDARFDPGLLAWTYSLFDVFDNHSAYKLVVGLLLAVALVAIGLCVGAITKHWMLAAAFILVVSGTLQVRLWADGITSFAGVVALSACLTFGALLLLLIRSGRRSAILAGLLYTAALLTYESVVLFAPVLIAIIIFTNRDWRRASAIFVPAAIAFLTAISLRLFTDAHPVPEYTISLGPSAVLSTFAKQIIAALPLSQWWLGHTHGLPPIAGTLLLLSAALMGVPAFVGLYLVAQNLSLYGTRAVKLCSALGVWLWIAPAALVAVTKRWQTDIPWGQGYIPVVYEYLGLGLLLLSLWLLIGHRLRNTHRTSIAYAWSLGGAVVFALLSTATMAGNLSLMP